MIQNKQSAISVGLDIASPIILPQPKAPSLREKVEWHLNARFQARMPQGGFPPLPYDTVDLSYWKPALNQRVNFGDELSRTVVELMLARRGATLFDSAVRRRQMLAIGSVLHMAKDDAVVWGTGLHGAIPERDHRYGTLDVRAVRGPLTRKFLMDRGLDVPQVFGDPALLLPALTHGRFQVSGEHEIGFVPNLHDMAYVAKAQLATKFPNVRIIDPQQAWDVAVAEILRHRFILASSLHGLIVAEAFGIPALYVRLTEHEPLLKYQDYYGGTGRDITYVTSLEDGLAHGGVAFQGYDPTALMDAFPYDLWV